MDTPEFNSRSKQADDAFLVTLTIILETKEVTPEFAAETLARLLAYAHEVRLHSEDEGKGDPNLKFMPDSSRIEKILSQAERGDYHLLNPLLRRNRLG